MSISEGQERDRIKTEIYLKLIRFFLAAKTQRLNGALPIDDIAFSDHEVVDKLHEQPGPPRAARR
jgi:hypothetical protein